MMKIAIIAEDDSIYCEIPPEDFKQAIEVNLAEGKTLDQAFAIIMKELKKKSLVL